MKLLQRNQIRSLGSGPETLLFSHGFGCDQDVWRFITPHFQQDYRILLFDHAGSGSSEKKWYDSQHYSTLQSYADDVIEICQTLGLQKVTYVGHSVACIIGILAAIRRPDLIEQLILVAPSPCHYNVDDYEGGFPKDTIEELLKGMNSDYPGWARVMSTLVMGNPDRPELSEELRQNFCRTDPDSAQTFARATFLSDHRHALQELKQRTLILQCAQDAIAPQAVGKFMHQKIAKSEIRFLKATGHCPHLSASDEVIEEMDQFLKA